VVGEFMVNRCFYSFPFFLLTCFNYACCSTWSWTTNFGQKLWQHQDIYVIIYKGNFKHDTKRGLMWQWTFHKSFVLLELWCDCSCLKKKLKKFKGVRCIFIGYDERIKGYRLYNLVRQYAIISYFINPYNLIIKSLFQVWILDKIKWF
jgi:hypothetical protein